MVFNLLLTFYANCSNIIVMLFTSVGMVLSVINGENVEHSLYKDILQKLKKMKSPHKAEFLRYDYRFDPFLQQWRTMEDLRENGVCVEDPMLERMNFIRMAAAGDEKGIKAALLQGEDPESTDYTGCSALTVAASNRHGEVVQILYEAGANLDFRDSNVRTIY